MKAIQVTGVTLCLGFSSLGYSQGRADFPPAVGNDAATLVRKTQSLGEKIKRQELPEPTESEELFDSFDPMERVRLQQQRRPLACAVLSMPPRESYYGRGVCDLRTRYPVEDIVVEKFISRAHCERGITYGLEGQQQIWFTHGCRLTFRIKTRKGASLSGTTIDCQSLNFQRATCPTKLRIRSMAVVAEYSRKEMCRSTPFYSNNNWAHGNRWGFQDDLVWVSLGCGGRFYVEGDAP